MGGDLSQENPKIKAPSGTNLYDLITQGLHVGDPGFQVSNADQDIQEIIHLGYTATAIIAWVKFYLPIKSPN